ncbi:MAG: ATP-binding protein [Leptolyngbyaceae cyanobacterium]
MIEKNTKTKTYEVNIRELVDLLGSRLYEDPDIVLRELISNASDACHFSAAKNKDSQPRKYRIEIFHEPPNQLIVRDNGRGMTETELKIHLSTVATRNKRQECEKLRREGKADYASRIIGEFGLGFLSTFAICEQVIVETVSEQTGDFQGWRWKSDGDTEYELAPFQGNESGTTVRLFLNLREYRQFSGSLYVRDIIKKYSRSLPIPIYYLQDGQAERLNDNSAPFEILDTDSKGRWQSFLRDMELFEDAKNWIDAIVINYKNVQGILYFPSYNSTAHRPLGRVDLYSKGVLIQSDNNEIIPQHLKCVRGILQSEYFKLTLDRNSIFMDETVNAIQTYLDTEIINYLIGLSKSDDQESEWRLKKILHIHGSTLLEGCLSLKDDETFCKIAEMLPLRTNQFSSTSVIEYLERSKSNRSDQVDRIFYYTKPLGNRQISNLVRKRQWELVDCSHTLYLLLLKRYTNYQNSHNRKSNFIFEDIIHLSDINEYLSLLFDEVEPDKGWLKIINYYNQLTHPTLKLDTRLAHHPNSEVPLVLLPKDNFPINDSHSDGFNEYSSAPKESLQEQVSKPKKIINASPLGIMQKECLLYVNKSNDLMAQLARQDNNIDLEILELTLHEIFHIVATFSDEFIDPVHLFDYHQKTLKQMVYLSGEVLRLEKQKIDEQEKMVEAETIHRLNLQEPQLSMDRTVFVSLPFKEPFLEEVYMDGLKPIIEANNLKPTMLMESMNLGNIPQEIVDSVANACFIVVDISEPSENIYYELGLAHGFDKMNRTLLIRDTFATEKVAFSAMPYRRLNYSRNYREFKTFLSEFEEILKSAVFG